METFLIIITALIWFTISLLVTYFLFSYTNCKFLTI